LQLKTEVVNPAELVCHAFSGIARHGISDVCVVTQFANIMDELRRSISPAAFEAIATLSDQVLITGERHASTSFDLKQMQVLQRSHEF
jgi:uncharacterized membrane protein